MHSEQPLTDNPFLRFSPPGHFYSPIPDLGLINERRKTLFDNTRREIPGIDVNEARQLDLLEKFAQFYPDIPFSKTPSDGLRYYYGNNFFSYGDAIALYCMIRHLKPKRIIEAGSGFSSAVMLDTNDRFFDSSIMLTFIEPYPERLLSLMRVNDKKNCRIITERVQDVPITELTSLDAGDILFIDSTHVVKIGSDVVHLVTEVLPRLKEGVIVHFHDIFWPFEYPEAWLLEGRAWNEDYLLKAFLQFNSMFRIKFFNNYIGLFHPESLKQHLPLFMKDYGCSLWLEKTKA
jgi:predicted O-methyltransferase YrrM